MKGTCNHCDEPSTKLEYCSDCGDTVCPDCRTKSPLMGGDIQCNDCREDEREKAGL